MPDLSIIGLGMASLDLLIRAETLPTWEKGTKLSAIALEGGGPVATALVAAKRLGVPTGFIGTYGSDRIGELKLQSLVEYGVDVSYMVKRPQVENQFVLVAVNEKTGDRVFSGVSVESIPLSIEEISRDYIVQAEYLHLDGYHIDAAHQAAEWMKSAGKRVMLDGSATRGPVSPKMVDLVRKVDYLICGKGFGFAITGKADLWEAGKSILSMGPKVVVQTEGEDGSYTTTLNEKFHIPAFTVPVVDTTGAGDVFHGAFLVGLMKRWKIRNIVTFCTAVSALKCMHMSGRIGIPTLAETIKFLLDQGRDFNEPHY